MGGGVELALACRYRVAVDQPGTRFALPEVMLGILPGWGGVKRLPRLVGTTAALAMLLAGRAVDARRAKRLGLVDEAVPPRIQDNAARMMVLEAPRPRTLPLFQRLMNSGLVRPLVVHLARRELASRASPDHYPAPYAILELWRRYDGDPFAPRPEDPASVIGLLEGDTARNLIRIFFLQERLKSLGKDSDFKAQHVHVVGAGVMGGDIAAWCAMRGLTVTLQDQSAERLAPAMKRATELFKRRLRDKSRIRDALDRLIPDVAGDGARRAGDARRGGHCVRHGDGADRAGRYGGPRHLPRGGQGIGGRKRRTPEKTRGTRRRGKSRQENRPRLLRVAERQGAQRRRARRHARTHR